MKVMVVARSTYWNMAYGQMPGDALEDDESITNMRNLGKNMAWILRKIHKE